MAGPNVHVPAMVTNAPVGAVMVVPSGDKLAAASADACIVAFWTGSALAPVCLSPPLPQPESPRKSSDARKIAQGTLDPAKRQFDMT